MTDRAAWLLERRTHVGGSDVAGILGRSPWASPWSVWADKVGLTPLDDEATPSMDLGRDLEPVIVRWFTRRTGLTVAGEQTVLRHPDYDWAAVTVDGVVVDPVDSDVIDDDRDVEAALGIFEAKYDAGAPWDEVPEHYRLQALWAMICSGLDHAWLACMHMPFGRPRFEVYELDYDPRLGTSLLGTVERFWFDHVVTGVPPMADGHPATTSALAAAWVDPVAVPPVNVGELSHVVSELAALRETRRQLDKDIEHDENLIKAALGDRTEGVIDGQLVVSWRQQDRHGLDTKALRADYPDLAERYIRVTQNRAVRLHTPRTRRIA